MIHTDASTIEPSTHVMVKFEDPQWGNVYQPGRTRVPAPQSGRLWEVVLDQDLHGRSVVSHLTDGAEIITLIEDEPKRGRNDVLDIEDQDGDVLTVYRGSAARRESGYPNTAVVLELPSAVSAAFLDRDGLRTLADALYGVIAEIDEAEEQVAFTESVAGDPPRQLPLAGGCCGGTCHV